MAANIKEEAKKMVDELPEDATWEDLEYRIYVRRKIEQGIESAERGETLTMDEVRARFPVRKSEG